MSPLRKHSSVLLLSLLSLGSNQNGAFGQPTYSKPCIVATSFKAPFITDCSYDSVVASLKLKLGRIGRCVDRDPNEELLSLLNMTTSEAQAHIKQVCTGAVAENVQRNFTFKDIMSQDEAYVQDFFDGTKEWERGGRRIQQLHNSMSPKLFIQWPNDLPNFDRCEANAAMCCWVEAQSNATTNSGSDVCLMDHLMTAPSSHLSDAYTIFDEENDGGVHCSGFAWSNDDSDWSNLYKGNTLFHTSMYKHRQNGGIVSRNIPGAPMCGCIEKMPIVTRADCVEMVVSSRFGIVFDTLTPKLKIKLWKNIITFKPCEGANNQTNDFASYYKKLAWNKKVSATQKLLFDKNIVGEENCEDAVEDFLLTKGFERAPLTSV
eukprot:scaffold6061_cov51-Attheya_sp.AAC.2